MDRHSTEPPPGPGRALFAVASLLFFTASPLYFYSNNNSASLRNSNTLEYSQSTNRRQLSPVALTSFNDPRTTLLKQLPFTYTFSSTDSHCIPPAEVSELARALRDLYDRHSVRVFPRNGFLLGIIRHGGYLPTEKFPDADLGIVPADVHALAESDESVVRNEMVKVGDFTLARKPTEDRFVKKSGGWVNWHARNPANTNVEYPYFGVRVNRKGYYSGIATSAYPYEKPRADGSVGGYFFPSLNLPDYNHESNMKEMMRYNTEGANYRLLDTDELLTEQNAQNNHGAQIGTVVTSNLDCMTLKQFYFTHIYVPCDYEEILTNFYGSGWNHVENRGQDGKGSEVSVKLSDEEHLKALENGPKPLCAQ